MFYLSVAWLGPRVAVYATGGWGRGGLVAVDIDNGIGDTQLLVLLITPG